MLNASKFGTRLSSTSRWDEICVCGSGRKTSNETAGSIKHVYKFIVPLDWDKSNKFYSFSRFYIRNSNENVCVLAWYRPFGKHFLWVTSRSAKTDSAFQIPQNASIQNENDSIRPIHYFVKKEKISCTVDLPVGKCPWFNKNKHTINEPYAKHECAWNGIQPLFNCIFRKMWNKKKNISKKYLKSID